MEPPTSERRNPRRSKSSKCPVSYSSWRGLCMTPSARGSPVDALAQGDGIELGVGGLFLVQIGSEETHDVVVPEFFGPGDQGAVAGNLVVLDRLRACNDRRVQHGFVLDF